MRVIECDKCGETVQAADDQELLARLAAHHRDAHADAPGAVRLRELIAVEAYDATDS